MLGTGVLLALGLWREQPLAAIGHASASVHWGIVYLALCSSVLGYLFWFAATRKLGAARTASFFNLVPVFTLAIALIGGQVLQAGQLAGVVAVIGGVVLASRSGKVVVAKQEAAMASAQRCRA